MGGAAGVGAGLGIMGGILGGIGDIMQATKYERPSLPEPGEQESALRRWSQNMLRGGSQQLQGATSLYNQMAPILLGQLPGMRMVPAGAGETGMGGDQQNPLGSYQQSLQALQAAQARQVKIDALKRQVKGTKDKIAKKPLRQQLNALRQEKKSSPTIAQLERTSMNTAMTPPTPSIRYGGGTSGSTPAPTPQSSLAEVRGLMDALGGGGPDLRAAYEQGMG